MGTFDGKVVIVTGASSGLGEAAARKFAAGGAQVVLAARREEKGFAVEKSITEAGGQAMFVRTDVTRRADVQALVERTVDTYGQLDCAVNNAGIAGPVMIPLADIEEEAWDELMNTNLKAVFMCMKYEIPAMLRNGRGSIVNISSAYGHKPSDLCHSPYAASKFAVNGLSKSAAIDYGQQGIRINVVSPGWTHSEIVDYYLDEAPELVQQTVGRMSAMNRVAEASETAEAIAWLCSDAASYVTGAILAVDGGDTTRLV